MVEQLARDLEFERSRRILVVDDDQNFAESLRQLMSLKGYEVEVANTAVSAQERLTDFAAEVALVDVRLGTSDGVKLISGLRQRCPGLLCVAMTAYASTDTAIAALRQGAYNYLQKPFHPEDLASTLTRCFEQLDLRAQKHEAEEVLKKTLSELEARVADRTAKLSAANVRLQMQINERILVEQSLRETQSRLSQAARTARLGHWNFDEVKNEYLSVSEEFARIFGFTVEAFMAKYRTLKDNLELVHPEDLAKVLSAYEKAGTTTEVDYRILQPQGSVCYVREIYKGILDETGKTIESIGTLQDITELKEVELALRESEAKLEERVKQRTEALTESNLALGREIDERKLTEAALQESEAQFRDYAETAADYFWEMGPDLRFTHFNGRYKEVTGIAPERAIGLTRDELFADWVSSNDETTDPFATVKPQQNFENVEIQWNHPNGSVRILAVSGKAIYDADGNFSGYRGSGRDITETHTLTNKLSYQASHDVLTDLINRREFENRLHRVLETAQAESTTHALCYLDLDQFKVINDTCGHTAGDELLRQLGAVLQASARKRDSVARLGGDEFGILMEHCTLEQAERVAATFLGAFEAFRFQWEDKVFTIGVSIGLVPITEASESMAEIMRAGDTACLAAKEQGRNRILVYRPDDVAISRRYGEMQWISQINRALAEDHFRLYYQPIVPLARPTEGDHYELLLRMVNEQGRIVLPGAFLESAERYNLATKIDRWVVSTAFKWISRHPSHISKLYLCSINLSARSLGDEEFLEFVNRHFEMFDVPPQKICFEITETAAISNLPAANHFIEDLKNKGCKFALDDFGSGLSSFAYLKNLPVDLLKIDGMFVKDIDTNPTNLAMVKSIHEIGRVMGKKTVAEFVESDAVLEKLRELGVDYAQGYYLGRPRPLDQ